MKRALAKTMRRSPTPAEAILWRVLRAGALDGVHFRRQQVIWGFIADFYSHAHRLVIEVDGEVHAAQTRADRERDEILRAAGLRVIRVSNDDVELRLPMVIARIRHALAPQSG